MKFRPAKLLPRRRWQRWLLVVALLLGVAYLLIPQLAAPYVRGKLRAMVESKLDAELQMGGLTYLPPFGVRVRDARIVTRAPEAGGAPVELLKLARLDLRLAKLPFGEGPLVIERIEVQDPEVHLVQTAAGFVGLRRAEPGKEQERGLPAGTKLSDMFELRHLSITGGRVVSEDRGRPDSVPMVWSNLSVTTDTTPTSKSSYAFRLTADHKDVASLNSTGSFDLDALHLKLDTANLAIATDPAQPTSGLPAKVQDAIRTHRVKGKLGVAATADLRFQDIGAATFDVKFDLTGASAYFPKTESTLDKVTLVMRCRTVEIPGSNKASAPATQPQDDTAATAPSTAPAVPAIRVDIEQFEIASGPARMTVEGPKGGKPLVLVDRARNRWTLNELLGEFDFGPASEGADDEATSRSEQTGDLPLPRTRGLPRSGNVSGQGRGADADQLKNEERAEDSGEPSPHPSPRRTRVSEDAAQADARERREDDPPNARGLIDRLDLAGRATFSATAGGPLKPTGDTSFAESIDYEAVLRPDGLRVRPPKVPLPFEDLGRGTIEFAPRLVTFRGLTGTYGGDGLVLRGARIPIPDDPGDLKDTFAVEEIDASIDFHRPNRPYPGGFGKVVDRLRPAGVFDIGGGSFFRVNRVPPADDGTPPEQPRKSDWFFGVSSDDGSFLLTDKRIPLDHIRGDATVSNMLIDITRLECEILGGRGTASGTIMPRKPYLVEGGRVALREIDLAELARTLEPDDPNDKLVGRAFLNFVFDGALATDKEDGTTAADALRGRGEFEVIEGHFWTLPVLGQVASETKQGDALTLGEAAAVFTVADRTVEFRNAAVNSPALGLVGSGTIGFDKSLDLRIVAAPLGDWRDNIKRGRIPIVSDVAGEVVGGVQKLLNVATRTLLYEFRVGGTVSDPAMQTVPAPILTDPVALLLGRMVDDTRKARLIDSVRTEPAE